MSNMTNTFTIEDKSTPLCESVKQALQTYFDTLEGEDPVNLYQLVLEEIEVPLIEAILKHTNNNQSKSAVQLGLSRGTFRKKLKQYGFIPDTIKDTDR